MRSSSRLVDTLVLVWLGGLVACGGEVADLEGPTPGPTPGKVPTGTVRTVLENEYLFVHEVTVPPGESLDRGQREDRLVLALTPVVLDAYEGADRERLDMTPGEVRWWQAVVERLENPTDRPVRFLEVVRRPNDLPPVPAVPPERTAADLEGAEVLIERREATRDVRAVRLELPADTLVGPFWSLPGLLVVEQGTVDVTPEGAEVAHRVTADGPVWLDPGVYQLASGGGPARVVIAGFGR